MGSHSLPFPPPREFFGSFEQKLVREQLRGAIAQRNRVGPQAALLFRGVERVKVAGEVSEEVDVIEGVPSLDAAVCQKTAKLRPGMPERARCV